MDGDRTANALARIEAALARIETAPRRTGPASGGDDLQNLQVRHDRLRIAVHETLAQLDEWIEESGR